jgi:hypothetical protein
MAYEALTQEPWIYGAKYEVQLAQGDSSFCRTQR